MEKSAEISRKYNVKCFTYLGKPFCAVKVVTFFIYSVNEVVCAALCKSGDLKTFCV